MEFTRVPSLSVFPDIFQCFLPDVPWTLILYKLYTVVVWYSNLNDKRLSDNRNPKVSQKKTWSKFLDDAPEETWHYRSESNQKTWPRWCKLNCWPWMRKIRADDNNIDFDCSIIVGELIEESSYEVFSSLGNGCLSEVKKLSIPSNSVPSWIFRRVTRLPLPVKVKWYFIFPIFWIIKYSNRKNMESSGIRVVWKGNWEERKDGKF